jgi:23S rRNA (uracil1939-C5)-methyltransferase
MSAGDDGWLHIDSLDLEGQGVARRDDGKVVFVEGALPGETVQAHIVRRKPQWEQGVMTALRDPSAQRVPPRCPHFGLHPGACGGCRMQHLHPSAQLAIKQRALEDALKRVGQVEPAMVLRPLAGPAWGYRRRARLSVRHVAKKGGVLVGFHERRSSYVADMNGCEVLPPAVGALLPALRELVGALRARDRLPQIELAVGDAPPGTTTVLVLRHLEPLHADDVARLRAFGREHALQWWLQPGGPDTARALDAGGPALEYDLPEFGLRLGFSPTDFTQVNHDVNRALVSRAVRLLDPQPGDRVIDWFCGLGNFSLPLATRAGALLGVEGSAALVHRARDNAERNGLAARTAFEARDLFALDAATLRGLGSADGWLVDPPREGAFALVKALVDLQQEDGQRWRPPRRIVYVSCNPATLARDAGLLVHRGGWRCSAAGVVDMFPHTAHVESIAVFDRPGAPALNGPPAPAGSG